MSIEICAEFLTDPQPHTQAVHQFDASFVHGYIVSEGVRVSVSRRGPRSPVTACSEAATSQACAAAPNPRTHSLPLGSRRITQHPPQREPDPTPRLCTEFKHSILKKNVHPLQIHHSRSRPRGYPHHDARARCARRPGARATPSRRRSPLRRRRSRRPRPRHAARTRRREPLARLGARFAPVGASARVERRAGGGGERRELRGGRRCVALSSDSARPAATWR